MTTKKPRLITQALRDSLRALNRFDDRGMESFGFTCASAPVNGLSFSLPKKKQRELEAAVAQRLNAERARSARLVRYLARLPRNHPDWKLILKHIPFAIKMGKKAEAKTR